MRRREFIAYIGGAAACPLAARAQQPAMPVVGFLHDGSPESRANLVAAFRQSLSEASYVDGRDVLIEYRWAQDQFDRLAGLAADLVRRQVAVIVTGGGIGPALAAKAATNAIPIVFQVGADPVKLGLVDSFNRPGGNATGVSYFTFELGPKRFGLLRELMPASSDVVALVNPAILAKMPRYFSYLKIQRGCTYKWTYKGTAENGRQRACRFQRLAAPRVPTREQTRRPLSLSCGEGVRENPLPLSAKRCHPTLSISSTRSKTSQRACGSTRAVASIISAGCASCTAPTGPPPTDWA
jgi:ABC transporter substrate binding protein